MSLKCMTWAFTLPLPPHPLCVMLAIADNANDEGVCWPRISTIADKATMNDRTVQRWLSTFERMGLIARFKRHDEARGGAQTSSEIRINLSMTPADVRDALEGLKAANDDEPAGREDGGGDTETPPGVTEGHPLPGAAAVTPPVTLVSPSYDAEPSGEPLSPKPPCPANDDRPEDDGFSRFRDAYPIPVSSVPRTLAIWGTLEGDERERAIAGARSYAAFAARHPKRAVMNAHRWLSEKGWIGYGAGTSASTVAGASVFVLAGSPQGDAWTVYRKTFGLYVAPPRPGPSGARGWNCPAEWPPFGRGFRPDDEGVFVVHRSHQWWAWMKRLRECEPTWDGRLGIRHAPAGSGLPPGTQGRDFPSEWPPSKSGETRIGPDDVENFTG
jgi:hypothetical protein